MPPRFSSFRPTCLAAAILIGLSPSTGLAQTKADATGLLEAPVNGLLGIGPAFSITSIAPDGTAHMKITERSDKVFAQTVGVLFPEGYFLLLAPLNNGSGKFDVIRTQVTDVAEGPELTVITSPEAAARLKVGEGYTLVRPIGATTARMRALPGIIPFAVEPGDQPDPKFLENRARSINHLKQIGLAMANFESAHNRFPAAVIYGPDGKPWHSWRVLLLPFLEQNELFNEYDFNQPWDSEKNRKLIPRMPDVYREPAYGADKKFSAHYAALVGDGALFPPQGAKQSSNLGATVPIGKGGRGIAEITDGTSNTIAIVPVDPAREIPWTKPEDITVGLNFPGLGKPGGIATPYTLAGKKGAPGVAPILFCDGSVQLIASTINPFVLGAIMSPNAGEVVSRDAIPHDNLTNQPNRLLKIRIVGKQATATIE